MAWSVNFMNLSNTERLQALDAVNTKVRDLRRGVIAAMRVEESVQKSTRTFDPSLGTLITDIDGGLEGQTPGIVGLAESLEGEFSA